ncbi:hypothetical protein EJ02DRAFT_190856 [Clathrospora elynae]|uniref:Uncharacterized protein n=1 Tax=Clathrospora elynae TaxID=706981 RepID=A0A6A5SPM1_9PLEO|nr:hypothetical protein EJ02DRAFT_190856 [Clathrospora elynae]
MLVSASSVHSAFISACSVDFFCSTSNIIAGTSSCRSTVALTQVHMCCKRVAFEAQLLVSTQYSASCILYCSVCAVLVGQLGRVGASL